jgi:hypothetical protein
MRHRFILDQGEYVHQAHKLRADHRSANPTIPDSRRERFDALAQDAEYAWPEALNGNHFAHPWRVPLIQIGARRRVEKGVLSHAAPNASQFPIGQVSHTRLREWWACSRRC